MRTTVDPSDHADDYPFGHDLRVRFAETDAMGIVHHSNYLVYFEAARVGFLESIGHPFTEWRAAGLESPVLEAFVRYLQPLEFDDVARIHVALAARTRATFQMAYLVTVGGDARATGVTVHGCTRGGRPTRLPGWLSAFPISQF